MYTWVVGQKFEGVRGSRGSGRVKGRVSSRGELVFWFPSKVCTCLNGAAGTLFCERYNYRIHLVFSVSFVPLWRSREIAIVYWRYAIINYTERLGALAQRDRWWTITVTVWDDIGWTYPNIMQCTYLRRVDWFSEDYRVDDAVKPVLLPILRISVQTSFGIWFRLQTHVPAVVRLFRYRLMATHCVISYEM